MEEKSMTALVSAFARAYHVENDIIKIFDDSIARLLLRDQEYFQISRSMAEGIGFFNPKFMGSGEEALRWIVDNQLSPTPLARAVFAEKALQAAVSIGATQYIILGAGYDTFAYRQPIWARDIQIFEVDLPATAEDKRIRLEERKIDLPENVHFIHADFAKELWHQELIKCADFQENKISFCSLLGVVYYLSKQAFEKFITTLSLVIPDGSSLVFDYPVERSYSDIDDEPWNKQIMLAESAKEKMLASYSYKEMEKILSKHGFLIYEHLTPVEMTEQYFKKYNQGNPSHPIKAFEQVNYCLAVRK
ncbi:class I SAM-dependent methyltransferase [Anaerotignum sp.]|uniref:class I SAM-dependent methyltransferase n=1 Tax=Anaerotignum sp. TaxID=2039241 RepID=UPI002897CF39|nr:class I SAM-dependent methyltransferase [Anaerotignum sp.]